MVELQSRPRIGQYILTKPLACGGLGERHLALHELDATSHVVVRPAIGRDRYEQRRVLGVIDRLRRLSHPHILQIEAHGLDLRGHPWIVTPFTGDASGIITLEAHIRAKDGFLAPGEAREAAVHLLQASAHAHEHGFVHGPLAMSEVLVDRRGRLLIEFYGLAIALRRTEADPELTRREEVRSIVRMAYQLVTGLLPEEPVIPAGRVVRGLEAGWDDWFETGLISGAGFRSAAHALSALLERQSEPVSGNRVGVRSVLRRLLFAGA